MCNNALHSGTCPKNEQWVGCEAGYCEPKYCTDLGYPIGCPGIVGPCKGGCVCNNGSVRNIFGICIPIEKCRKYIYSFRYLLYLISYLLPASGTGTVICNMISVYFSQLRWRQ